MSYVSEIINSNIELNKSLLFYQLVYEENNLANVRYLREFDYYIFCCN
ncbi:hypothetical protein EV197_0600 [Aquimarina brevivitae]|uniref:Uncharacterized protein n=1 Tax=Aquimarina brevivitae TaxID=323412 RepID=A0A4Q7PHV8_9FLAO|nr:hypothetical protein EV197_0600 [Aquimarina brevivitae]